MPDLAPRAPAAATLAPGAVTADTWSVCPTCLRRVPAQRVERGAEVHLRKRCPEHGESGCVIWRGPPSWQEWGALRARGQERAPDGGPSPDCPFGCGLCDHHRQPTCCVLLEVTGRCNLRCPICFAGAGGDRPDPELPSLLRRLRGLRERAGAFNLQLSGGEPTLREDLPALIARARGLGVPFVQLNSNGLRLAREPGYARSLAAAGLGCVFLQFDGLDDRVHRRLRGAPLAALKLRALDRCAEAELGVVLVPTLVPGVNDGDLGAILRFAIARAPAVRGVHFQPVSWFGRCDRVPGDEDRITLPEVLRAIELQTGGAVRVAQLHPPAAESPHCSFSGTFRVEDGGRLAHAARSAGSCCGGAADRSRRAREHLASRWAWPRAATGAPDALDRFLADEARRSFCISGMAFQDAWSLDLERLRDCYLHVAAADGAAPDGARLVPFCAFNLSGAAGASPHRAGLLPVGGGPC